MQSERITEERLWADIKHNLDKDLSKKDTIIIKNMDSVKKSTNATNSTVDKDVVFTCGHFFSREYFTGNIIPQLRDKLELFPTLLPVTSKLILSDYQQQFINLACPVCLYNYLRQKQNQPDKPLDRWDI